MFIHSKYGINDRSKDTTKVQLEKPFRLLGCLTELQGKGNLQVRKDSKTTTLPKAHTNMSNSC